MTLDCIVKPAGLRAPPKQRSVVQDDNCSKEILGLFEKYLKEVGVVWDDSYFLAEDMVRCLDLSDQSVIDAFIVHYQDEKIVTESKTGLFVSALYNKMKGDMIIYDHDLPMHNLGFRLSESKSLVVNGTAGDWCGWGSSGLVLVNGTAGVNCGFDSSGLVLVNGTAGDDCGLFSSSLVLVSGSAGGGCGGGSSGVVVEVKKGAVKSLGYSRKGLRIPYAGLVSNQALQGYISNLIASFAEISSDIQALPRPDVKSVIKNIRRLYRQ